MLSIGVHRARNCLAQRGRCRALEAVVASYQGGAAFVALKTPAEAQALLRKESMLRSPPSLPRQPSDVAGTTNRSSISSHTAKTALWAITAASAFAD
jgi:hypothetical protein